MLHRNTLPFILSLPLAVACGGSAPAQHVDPTVAAGAALYINHGCAACHGADGAGKTLGANHATPINTYMPAQENVIRAYIKAGKGLSASTPTGTAFMPAWQNVLNDAELDQLVAYVLAGLPAVEGVTFAPITGKDAAAGAKAYAQYGCVSCHGAAGAGGITNRGSEDGEIPKLVGDDFHEEFDTPEKIQSFIRDGAVLGNAPITSMPAFKDVMTADEIAAVTAYLESLR